jgi:hypothetical protein
VTDVEPVQQGWLVPKFALVPSPLSWQFLSSNSLFIAPPANIFCSQGSTADLMRGADMQVGLHFWPLSGSESLTIVAPFGG